MVTATQKLVPCCVTSPRLPGSGAHNAPFNYSSVAFFTTLTVSFLTTLLDGGEEAMYVVRVRGAAWCRRSPVGGARKARALLSLQSRRLKPWAAIMSSSEARERRRAEGWKEESHDEALTTHYILSVRK